MRSYFDARYRGVFNINATRILLDAFDEAWKSVQDNGSANARETRRGWDCWGDQVALFD